MNGERSFPEILNLYILNKVFVLLTFFSFVSNMLQRRNILHYVRLGMDNLVFQSHTQPYTYTQPLHRTRNRCDKYDKIRPNYLCLTIINSSETHTNTYVGTPLSSVFLLMLPQHIHHFDFSLGASLLLSYHLSYLPWKGR